MYVTFRIYCEQIRILDILFMNLYEEGKWGIIEANKGGFLRIAVSRNALEADLQRRMLGFEHAWAQPFLTNTIVLTNRGPGKC